MLKLPKQTARNTPGPETTFIRRDENLRFKLQLTLFTIQTRADKSAKWTLETVKRSDVITREIIGQSLNYIPILAAVPIKSLVVLRFVRNALTIEGLLGTLFIFVPFQLGKKVT